jgi:GAF domain-containing protein
MVLDVSPREGRSEHFGAGQAGRQASRRLAVALARNGVSAAELELLLSDGASVQELLKPALSDPDRLQSVRDTGLLDRPAPELDNAAALAALALGAPYAAVSLIAHDYSLRAGRYPEDGTDRSLPLDSSLCTFAVATAQPFIVDDTTRNPLIADNPLVRSGRIRSYAGIPLMERDGRPVGALASWDDNPRRWTTGQIQILTDFAAVVADKIFARQS